MKYSITIIIIYLLIPILLLISYINFIKYKERKDKELMAEIYKLREYSQESGKLMYKTAVLEYIIHSKDTAFYRINFDKIEKNYDSINNAKKIKK